MPFFLSAVIAGVAAAFIGDMFHSAVVGFVALVVISVVVLSVAATRRREETTA